MDKSQNILKLLEEILTLDQQNDLINSHINMVKTIANSMAQSLPSNVDRNDLYSAGREGLVQAARKFDPSRGVLFKTYAERRIRGAIGDELRAEDPASRDMRDKIKEYERTIQRLSHELGRKPDDEEVAKAMGMDIDAYYDFIDKNVASYPDTDREPEFDVFDLLNTGVSKDALQKAVNELPEDEKKVISLLLQDWDATEIAAEMNKSEGRISQIRDSAMVKLRKKLGAKSKEKGLSPAGKIMALDAE
jgi:RNA polymerase sigma factor for flagellar operon FliA